MPVWHAKSSIEELDWYVGQTDRIAIGGMIVTSNPRSRRRALEQGEAVPEGANTDYSNDRTIDVLQRIVTDRSWVKFHALGCSSMKFLSSVPVASADAGGYTFVPITTQCKIPYVHPTKGLIRIAIPHVLEEGQSLSLIHI